MFPDFSGKLKGFLFFYKALPAPPAGTKEEQAYVMWVRQGWGTRSLGSMQLDKRWASSEMNQKEAVREEGL